LFFLGLVPCFIAGYWFEKHATPSAPLTFKQVGDLGVAFSVVSMLGSMILYRPSTHAAHATLFVVVALGYPVLHLSMMLFGLTVLWQHSWGRRRKVLMLQVLAMAVLAFVATLYGHSLLTDTYQAGHNIDVYWVACFCLIIW